MYTEFWKHTSLTPIKHWFARVYDIQKLEGLTAGLEVKSKNGSI